MSNNNAINCSSVNADNILNFCNISYVSIVPHSCIFFVMISVNSDNLNFTKAHTRDVLEPVVLLKKFLTELSS